MVYKAISDESLTNTMNWLTRFRLFVWSLISYLTNQKEENVKVFELSTAHIEILKDCRFYLEKLCLCNDKRVRIANYAVSFTMMNILCVVPQTISLYCLARAVYEANFDLNEVSTAIANCIGISQIELIYFTLAANRPTTFKLMNKMQSVVDDRKPIQVKLIFWFYFSWNLYFLFGNLDIQ